MTDEFVSAEEFNAMKAEMADRLDDIRTSQKSYLEATRTPSMALRIGSGPNPAAQRPDFVRSVLMARSTDSVIQAEGKAALESVSTFREVPSYSKSTLGSTDATGGYLIPNNVVDDIVKPALYNNPWTSLVTTINGVNATGVDIPWRSAAPSRATIIGWGDTKTNVDLTYNGYTATMHTLASIYDISRQFAMKSNGAAEQDVMSELGGRLSLGVGYYIREGAGSTEPYGIITALTNAPGTFTTSHTPDADTISGAVASAIANAAGDVMSRNRKPNGVIMSPTGYKALITDGAATMGYTAGGPMTIDVNGQLRIFGLPIYVDAEFPADDLIVADFAAFKCYFGDGPRFDTSEHANERWDRNLLGVRGELEMAFDARPAVFAGAAQYVADIIE